MTSKTAIQQFGKHDFMRLVDIGSDAVLKIEEIHDEELRKAEAILKELIKAEKVFIMDKDTGVAFQASVVIGYDKGKILIACER